MMVTYLEDNQQSWDVLPDGSSHRVRLKEGEEPHKRPQLFHDSRQPLRSW